jgi:hypothetical protein
MIHYARIYGLAWSAWKSAILSTDFSELSRIATHGSESCVRTEIASMIVLAGTFPKWRNCPA